MMTDGDDSNNVKRLKRGHNQLLEAVLWTITSNASMMLEVRAKIEFKSSNK